MRLYRSYLILLGLFMMCSVYVLGNEHATNVDFDSELAVIPDLPIKKRIFPPKQHDLTWVQRTMKKKMQKQLYVKLNCTKDFVSKMNTSFWDMNHFQLEVLNQNETLETLKQQH